jgi:ABC-type thiamin/hydroxymethylpyrimidine transport system permease subunit
MVNTTLINLKNWLKYRIFYVWIFESAIRAMMARRVGSAMAWNLSRLVERFFMQPTDCKYIGNQTIVQDFFQSFFKKGYWGEAHIKDIYTTNRYF